MEENIYQKMWERTNIQKPEIWPLWKITKNFQGKLLLEIGAGSLPRIPIKNSYFLDISESSAKNLKQAGGISFIGDTEAIPFKEDVFDLVVASEVLEHVSEDTKAISEISRVIKPSGFFLFSVPIGMKHYSKIDVLSGHKRRYEVENLDRILTANNLKIIKFQEPSFFIKVVHKIVEDLLPARNLMEQEKVKKPIDVVIIPRLVFDIYYRILSLFQKIFLSNWKNSQNLSGYKERWIVIMCKKNG